MKFSNVRSICCFVVPVVYFAVVNPSAWAAPVPGSLSTLLNQREQRLGQTTAVWQIKSCIELDPLIIAHEKKLPASERTSPIMNGGSTWQITRNNGSTLISGTCFNSVPSVVTPYYHQFYNNDVGLVVQKPIYASMKGKSGRIRQVNVAASPVVWPTPGDSRLYSSPAPFGLPVFPAHFVALSGISPLGMYGAKWSLIATTPKTWVLEGTIANTPFVDEKNVQIVLSRLYGGAPVNILISSSQTPAKEDWDISQYQRYDNSWIARKVVHHLNAPRIAQTEETYILESFTKSRPIVLPIVPGAEVRDYRLVAAQLSSEDAYQADKHLKRGIIYYQWSGRLPSRDELKKIQLQQHPGEASPDPGQSGSAMPFAGGLMCLVGGVWMFKQRRAN